MHRPASCRESAFYLCYRIFVGGGVLDAPPGAAKKRSNVLSKSNLLRNDVYTGPDAKG